MNLYQESQLHIVEANKLLEVGEIYDARSHFLQAAELQWSFVRSLPSDRIRTISIYGLSAATLFYRGQALDMAEHIACDLLSRPYIETHAQSGLRDLLARVWNERKLDEIGYRLAGKPISVTFRNGEILHGLAPTDVIDTPIRSVLNAFQRIAAWMSHIPFTPKPQAIMKERYRAFSSEPVLSSYRIDLFLAESPQLEIPGLESTLPPPSAVLDSFIKMARYTSQGNLEELQKLVPDEQYRNTFVRLLRNVVPDGTHVGEVELRSVDEPKENAVTLYSGHIEPIRQILRQSVPLKVFGAVEDDSKTEQFSGILRAVDLDENMLRLDMAGNKMQFRKKEDILDDVVGPLLNKPVVITGKFPSRKKGTRFLAYDIEPALDK